MSSGMAPKMKMTPTAGSSSQKTAGGLVILG
jgi:hypothetical protein